MGCNFYTLKNKHIGKRSAAGQYCWDCNVTLCKSGPHSAAGDDEWFTNCPSCGEKPAKESLDNSSAGRELGFNKNPFKKKTGVQSCSSFSWVMEKRKLKTIKKIKDEYDRIYTIKDFHLILEECPIQHYRSFGREFS